MLKKFFPLIIIIFVPFLVFRNFFLKGLLPIPGDLLIGAYYPWLDYKWGFLTGVPVKNPLPSDVISLLYPWRILGMEMVKSGHLPLWDSTILLGTPLLANFQAALLNPFNILFLVLPSPVAWGVQVILQPLLIALAMFLFLRDIGLQKLAAVFGGLTFAFSGFAVVWMEYNTIGFTLFYFPLALFLADKIIQSKKVIHAFLLGLVIALQLFSGYPQISIYTVMFSAVYFIFRLYQKQTQKPAKFLLFILGLGSAIFFAAIQLLPSYELLQLSIRSVDNTAFNAGVQFLPLTHLITLFIPDFFGNPVTANYWLGSYDNFAFSLPAVSLFLALIALTSKVIFKKENIIFLIFAALSLLFAIDNPLSRFVSGNDYLGLKSAVAARAIFVFDFALAVAAAYGVNELFVKRRFKLVSVLISWLFLAGVVGAAFLILKLNDWSYASVAMRNSVLPLLTVSLAAASLSIGRLWKLGMAIIFGLLVFNILTSTDKNLSFINPKLLYPQTEVIIQLQNNLKNHRFDREKGEIFSSNTWAPYGLKAVSGQNAIYPLSVSKYLSLVNGYYPNYLFRFVDVTGIESPLYDTLDIHYLLALKRKNGMGPDASGQILPKFLNSKFKEYRDIGTIKILENTSNLGSGWFSKNVICNDNEEDAVKILKQKLYNPRDLMTVNCPKGDSVENRDLGKADVKIEKPNYWKLDVTTPEVNLLTISQAFYPGWEAFIDGQRVPLYLANLALTSVPVPQGEHQLELKYSPQSFYNGAKISLITLIFWLLYLLGSLLWKRYNLIRE